MNIGLLEDDPSIAEIYTFALEAQGYTVFWHTTGNSLLQALLENEQPRTPLPYQLLLVDLLLPGELSGAETVQSLYQQIDPTLLPVILLSGADSAVLEEIQRSFPTILVLRKPTGPRHLVHIVGKLASSLPPQ